MKEKGKGIIKMVLVKRSWKTSTMRSHKRLSWAIAMTKEQHSVID